MEKPDIKVEKAEIESAPKVPPGPVLGRCHWCGRLTHERHPHHDYLGGHLVNERFKCPTCVGATFNE
jgi:hypothetical protein